jgi:hypothetical protein
MRRQPLALRQSKNPGTRGVILVMIELRTLLTRLRLRPTSHVRLSVATTGGPPPEPNVNLPHSVAEILTEHVTFQLESIDRMYLNVYIPELQYNTKAG